MPDPNRPATDSVPVLPAKLPSGWVEQIEEAVRSATSSAVQPSCAFPNTVPQSWLDKIKDACKSERPSWLAIVLGSSLVASVIGGFLSYYTASKVERVRSQHELQLDSARARVKVYRELSNNLGNLTADLNGFVASVKLAQQYPMTDQTRAQFQEDLRSAGKVLRDALATINEQEIQGEPVTADASEVLGRAGRVIGDAQKNPRRPPSKEISSVTDRLVECRARIQVQIDKELDRIR